MPRLRNLNGRQIVDILTGLGFETIRVKGSHHQLRKMVGDGRCNVTVPVHRGKSLPPGTLRSIIRQAQPCVDEEALKSLFYTE